MDKVAEKRKRGKDHAGKPLSKKAKREKFLVKLEKGDEHARKSAAKGEENKKSSEHITTKNALSDDAALVLVQPTSSGKDLQIIQEERALKFRKGASEKRTCTFWGKEIMKITKSYTDEEYDEVHTAWLKKWKMEQNALKRIRMLEFILAKKDGGESFKRNFIVYLVNYFFTGPKNRYCSKSILKYVKDIRHIVSLDWCQFILDKLITSVRHYKESKADKGVHFDGLLFFLMVSSPIQ
ncbi:hypothetical protein Cgig2_028215 [Carnegiea gigantea]|uniref:Uncharacterized protein n=1 Tax=Carnegiea gigantea TaxID=171969 RepID=A0A9Q1JNB0_9CARY|nr:hypothetical protein Cgig2_028215 [Carnegiea gigantea]